MAKQTASQTIGPYFAYGLIPEAYGHAGIATNSLISDQTKGARIRIEGRVLDGAGDPVDDALVEIWQANEAGRYAHPEDARDEVALDPAFHGFGRAGTDGEGRFRFETIKPGSVPGPGNAPQAPHICVIVHARGVLDHCFTRLYFADEGEANAIDPVLGSIDEARRGTLIAEREEAHGAVVYRFDIHLQGARETVFFDA